MNCLHSFIFAVMMASSIKSILSCLLVMAVLLQAFSKCIVLAEFELNKNFISKNLCVNKDKPSSGCNGHCHLVKQLKKDAERNDDSKGSKEKQEIVLYNQDTRKPLNVYRIEKNNSFPPVLKEHYSTLLKPVFHPPC